MVVFSGNIGLDPIGKSITFHLEERVPINSPEDVKTLLAIAKEEISVNLGDTHLGYTFKLGDRQLHGRGVENLLEDLGSVDGIISRLESAHETGPASKHATTGDPRPIVVGQTICEVGVFWFDDIPFEDASLRSFFERIDRDPRAYEHRPGVQIVAIHGRGQPLSNPRPENLTPDYSDMPLHIIADNPTYHRAEDVVANVEVSIPDYILDTLCSVNQLPYKVSGGYRDDDEAFSLNMIEMVYKDLMQTTLFTDTLCWAKANDDDDGLPHPFSEIVEDS
jgi:hypothetical protein